MPEWIDWPRQATPRRRQNRGLLILIAILALVFLGSRTAVSYWVNLLWFRSLGYGNVFVKMLGLQWAFFSAFAAVTFAVLYSVFSLLKRSHRADLPLDHTLLFGGREVTLSVRPVLNGIGIAGAGVVALVTGGAMASAWSTLALFWFAPRAGDGTLDPIFHKPVSFFLFTLPGLQLIAGWLLTLAILSCLAAGLFLLVSGGARALDERRLSGLQLPWRGLSLSAAFLLLVAAFRVWLNRFDLLFAHHTIFDGVTYTDAHVTLAGKWAVCAALVLGAAIAGANAARRPRGSWLLAAVIPAAACYLAFGVAGWYVTSFIVKPNELDRERPYIADNLAMTRRAFGLDHFLQRKFPAETTVAATDPANNEATFKNIRLWDWRALQDTLRQIQEIRTYYDFPDIDIDRYKIGGEMREVMLAARELNVDKLPESSQNWINEKLIYTHGYGITMNPVNGFTPEGLPTLTLANMPVQSTVPGLDVKQPEIYFGELTNTDVYVKTRQKEFNYPQGDTNNLTRYDGSGGIVLGGFLRRLLIAFDRGDLAKLPFSDDVTPESRLLMRRNVRSRVAELAPFLTFEQDPYIVLDDDGHLSWIIDGFTTSDEYPDSTHYQFGDGNINYMRNSVKAVIDAYNGTTTFYVFDEHDPILAAYRRVFPSLFRDASEMPAELRRHTRYPEWLLQLQAQVYGLYHMTDPEVFYNREDQWTVASQVGMGEGGEQTTQPMQPNFILMKLPGETGVEFVEILPFTPVNRNNLIGWIAGRSDGAYYGTTMVYDFPKTKLVDGPLQIEARIDQNAQLSGQLSLWNQQGSHVRRGGLLVIPSGKALLYAEPIYLQAERSPMPELRMVVLALQDQLAYGPTFESALTSLFGGSAPSLSAAPEAPAKTENAAAAPAAADLHGLISEAARDFDDYQRLTAEGKLGEAGQKLDALKQVLQKLSQHR